METIHKYILCFVIGLLMYESAHFTSLFLTYEALMDSYRDSVLTLFRHEPDN